MMSLFPQSVRVPVETLKDGAKRMAELADDVEDYFDQLGNMAACLQGDDSWVGDDVEAFIQTNEANQKKYKKTVKYIEDMADALQKYAEAMETIDHEWAENIKKI